MTGMRTAWQQVDLMWNTIITERRLLATPAMSEASDLLLRMGRLVWDNPQWTPARAGRGPRRDPAALAPGTGRVHRGPVRRPSRRRCPGPRRGHRHRHRAGRRPGRAAVRADPVAADAVRRPSRVRARADRARSWNCVTPTRMPPRPAPAPRSTWTSWPSRWQRPARPWDWPGRRPWLPPGGGAVTAPGPAARPPRSPAGGRVVHRQPCQHRPARAGRAGHPAAPGP